MKSMRKRNKKAGKQWLTQAFALVLAVSLCMSGLVGCGKKKEDDKTQGGQQTEQEKGNKPEDGVTDNTQGTEGEPEGGNDASENDGEITLPLSEEKAELSMWTTWQNSYLESLNEIPGMKEMEERTNVHINYIEVPQSQASEKYGLMLSSGNLPDMIFSASYPGGNTKGVEDGILVDLTDYIKDYTPNLATGMQTMGYPVEDGFYVSGVQAPVLNEGDKIEHRVPQSLADSVHCVITTSCKNVELAARWLDYQYTEAGMLENCLGVEGESYVVNDDGSYSYTELITNNPDGLTISDAIACNTRMGIGSVPGLYNAFKDTVIVDDEQLKGNINWMKDGLSMCMPAQRSLTEEEGAVYNLKYTDIETRASEYTIHVITGVESVDTFEDFVEELYAIGLKECLEIQQAACDRFYAR